MVLFGQKWLYSEKSGCIRAKQVVFVQSGCYWEKVVVFGQKWLYWKKSGSIRAKLVVFGQSGLLRINDCFRAKVVVFRQRFIFG